MIRDKKGLSYDDVLLVPKRSPVESRSNVDLSVELGNKGLVLEKPFISANMDTVTEAEMAQSMSDEGGLGIIHRFQSSENQAKQISNVDGLVGASVGINEDYLENAEKYIEAGADAICIDIAHGHMEACLEATEELSNKFPDITLIAGNVATKEGVRDHAERGADVIKVGIGPGSVCITRQVTGVGIPQFTAVKRAVEEAEKHDVSVIADGGASESGDIVKALMVGADAVMAGSLFGGCEESPGEIEKVNGEQVQEIRGMASEEARSEREIDQKGKSVEGKKGRVSYAGPVSRVVDDLAQGVRSGLSYCGGHTIEEARENAEFVEITHSTKERNGTHGIR